MATTDKSTARNIASAGKVTAEKVPAADDRRRYGVVVPKETKPPAPSIGDRLNALVTEWNKQEGDRDAAWERQPDPTTGNVRILFYTPQGDTISGNGATTEQAVADLEKRLEAWRGVQR